MFKFSLLSILLSVSLVFTISCSKADKCEDITCQNGGTCENGSCKCPTGYEGPLCETESLPKAIKITGIKFIKVPASKTDGTKWDADGTNADIYPVLYSMKADNKSVDVALWTSSVVATNAKTDGTVDLILISPEFKITTVDKLYAMFLFDLDGTASEVMGSGILFNPKEYIKGRPATIKLDCTQCAYAFELKVTYEF